MIRWIRTRWLHFLLLPLAFLWMYPFVWMVSASMKTQAQMWDSGLAIVPRPIVLDNYVRAWTKANFAGYFLNTVVFAVGTVLLVLILTSMSGYVMGRYRFPGRAAVYGIMLLTLMIPQGYTIIPLFELVERLGLLNTRTGLVLAESSASIVLYTFLFSGFFAQLPKDLEEAATVDGCNFPQKFLYVMLPLSAPIIATVTIFQFINAWKSFFLPMVFTFNNPSLRTLGVGMLSFVGEYSSDWTGMAAGATMSLLPMMLVFLLFQRFFIEGLVGAIKG